MRENGAKIKLFVVSKNKFRCSCFTRLGFSAFPEDAYDIPKHMEAFKKVIVKTTQKVMINRNCLWSGTI